ncbi:MAG TPA: family 2A encapsulin nanocompartment cargo protein cysteine desulfurase [Ferruginibacter sp.]|nr:family 2A encapsulin nanocompartment cargo protein cysteine desulfurase [Ferruginibacter sp.]HMP22101.1 family 2A encapsulin nanocompartment cargo protein cysteine desulfurase [Ferruginibacter sp.]
MSTNINSELPDIQLLQQLANQFFKAAPGENIVLPSLPQHAQHAINPEYQSYLLQAPFTQAVPASPGIATPAAAPATSGIGVTPGVDHLNLSDAVKTAVKTPFGLDSVAPASTGHIDTALPDSAQNFFSTQAVEPNSKTEKNFGTGRVPQSVAGSGKSPDAPHQYTDFNIEDPQTSLPDPHFSDGKVPKSVAGSGRQPSLQQQGAPGQSTVAKEELPYASDNSFEKILQEAMASINTFTSNPQLPFSAEPIASFYFLPKVNASPVDFPAAALSQKAQAGIAPPFDVNLVRRDFPILQEQVNGRQLIWFDNAATTQKPRQVIDRISYFYQHENSNIHRAAHELAARATDAYEAAREKVRRFINAASINEIIFVRGTTEGINLVAKSWGEQYLNTGDEIILSNLEHHANIVPWQQLAAKKNLKIKVIPVDDNGQLLIDEYAKLLGPKVKLVSFTHVSNALGTITPAKQIIDMAHAAGAKVLLDGAQSVSHMKVDLQLLNPDWFIFSGHKIFGPTGIGVVYGKEELLNETQPWQGGGNMIKDVTFEHTTFHNAPGRFEAGTGNIADAVGLSAALDYVSQLGIELIGQYEHYLLLYATQLLQQVPGLRIIGTAPDKASVISFTLDGYKTEDVGAALNKEGIAVRAGHHCAQPILRRFGQETTVRPSLAFYNTCAEVDKLYSTLLRLKGQ